MKRLGLVLLALGLLVPVVWSAGFAKLGLISPRGYEAKLTPSGQLQFTLSAPTALAPTTPRGSGYTRYEFLYSQEPTTGLEIDASGKIHATIEGLGGGSFIGLSDAPASFAGQALKAVTVNAGATALVFTTLAGGGDALTANPLSQFAATTSAQLRSVLSDETGTGLAYFQGGALGTPASGVGTNLTGTAASLTAGLATALAANGTNCSAGQFPLGVDASGNSESCTALPTTIAGTANQITASAATGAITLSIPSSPTLPGTTTGAFSGNLTGNVTGNVTGTSGSTTGNAATATALAANGTNCTAGQFPLGVDASGNAESCSSTLVTPALGTPASGVMTNVTGTAAGLTAGAVTTNANLTGGITSVGNATTLKRSCQPGLGDGLNAVAAGTYPVIGCYNGFGSTWTITAIKCYSDNNGTTTLDVKNGAAPSPPVPTFFPWFSRAPAHDRPTYLRAIQERFFGREGEGWR